MKDLISTVGKRGGREEPNKGLDEPWELKNWQSRHYNQFLVKKTIQKYAKLTQYGTFFLMKSFVYLPPQFPYFALFSVSQGFSEASSPQTDQVYSPNGGFIMPSPESFYSPKHFIPSLPYSGLPTLMKEELQPIDLSQHNSLNCDSPRKPLASLPTDQSLQDKNKSLLKL